MDVTFMQLIKALLFTNFCFYFADGFQNLGICGNSYCTVPIAEGTTLHTYIADSPEKLSFRPNENVVIYVKKNGKREDYLGVMINNKKGYVPAVFVKEEKSLITKDKLVPAEIDFLVNSETALSGAPSSSEWHPLEWSSDYEFFYPEHEEAPHPSPQFHQQQVHSSFPQSRLVPPNPRSSDQPDVRSSFSAQGDSGSHWDHSSWDHASHEPSSVHLSGSQNAFTHQHGSGSMSHQQGLGSPNTFGGDHSHQQGLGSLDTLGSDHTSHQQGQGSPNTFGGDHTSHSQGLGSPNTFGGDHTSHQQQSGPPNTVFTHTSHQQELGSPSTFGGDHMSHQQESGPPNTVFTHTSHQQGSGSPNTFGGDHMSHQGESHSHFSMDSSSFDSQNTFDGVHSSSYGVSQEYFSMNPSGHDSRGDYSSSHDGNQASPEHYSSRNAFAGGHYGDHSSVDPPAYHTHTNHYSSVDHSSAQVQFVMQDGRPLERDDDLWNTMRMLKEQGIDFDDDVYEQEEEGLKGGFAAEVEPSFSAKTEPRNPAETQSHPWRSSTPVLEEKYPAVDQDEDEIDIDEEEVKVEEITTPAALEKPSQERSTPSNSEKVDQNAEILKSKPEILSSRHEIPNSEVEIGSSVPVLSNSRVEFPTSRTQIPISEADVPNSEIGIASSKPIISNAQLEVPTSETEISKSKPGVPNSETEIESSKPAISNPQSEVPTPQTEIPKSEPDVPGSKVEVSNSDTEISSSQIDGFDKAVPSKTEAVLLATRESESPHLESLSSTFSEKGELPQLASSLGTPERESQFPTSSGNSMTDVDKLNEAKHSLSELESSVASIETVFPPGIEQNSSDSKEDISDFFQSRNLKEDYDQNQESEEPAESGFDFFGCFDNGLQAVRSFVEVLISWLPEPLHSLLLKVEEEGLSPRVPVFTLISSLPCLSLILALCYIKEKSKEKKLTALLAQSEKNVYELTAQKNILEEKIEKTSEELKSSSTLLDSERTSYESEVESLRERIKKKTLELDRSLKEIETLKEREEEYFQLVADHEKANAELTEQKTRVLELEESVSNLNTEIAQRENELDSLEKEQLQLVQAAKDSEERLNQLQQNCNQLLKEAEAWNERVKELTAQLSEVSSEREEVRTLLEARDEEVQSLTHLVQTMKSFEEVADGDETKSNEEVLKELLNATSLLIKLEHQEEENKSLSEKLLAEKSKSIEKDVELLESRSECDKLKLSYNQALQDRTEAQTKLDVLTNYFKDKEIQMQREIGAQEAVREKREKDADSAERRIVLIEQENSSYKYQVASMKQEMEETERNLKSQIATQEKKAHENWIAARAAERRLEDMKQEMSILKQRLTLLEQEAITAREEVLRPVPKRLGDEEPPLPPMFPPPPPMMLPLDRPLPPHLLPPLEPPPFRPPWHLDGPPDFRGRDTPPRGEPRHSSPLMRDSTPPPHDFHEGPPRPPFFPPMRFPPPPMWGSHRKPEDPLNHSSNRSHHSSSDSWHQSNSRA